MKEQIISILIDKFGIESVGDFDGIRIKTDNGTAQLIDDVLYDEEGNELFTEIDIEYLEQINQAFKTLNQCTACYGKGGYETFENGDQSVMEECDCEEKQFKY